jgi:hypothetical protein
MVTAKIENARLINEEHRKLNGNLREENKLLGKTLLDMYELFSQIDFSAYDGELKMCFGDSLEYDSVPWEKWEAVLDVVQANTLSIAPIQLRLF